MDNNDDYSYRIESKNGTERYYVSFVNTNKELTETEVPQDTFLAFIPNYMLYHIYSI